MKIKDLSKEELLKIIYHYLPNTIIEDQECYCITCSQIEEGVASCEYICDNCEDMVSQINLRVLP